MPYGALEDVVATCNRFRFVDAIRTYMQEFQLAIGILRSTVDH